MNDNKIKMFALVSNGQRSCLNPENLMGYVNHTIHVENIESLFGANIDQEVLSLNANLMIPPSVQIGSFATNQLINN
jgi:hypothetical protein